ncbi:M23 family metallopeptidase [Hoeflea sp.]|uniref:M23 family metallopeptidase n=1 Tax=Hoeflea sp. TaxID=1940281 RepID=UPI003BAE3819
MLVALDCLHSSNNVKAHGKPFSILRLATRLPWVVRAWLDGTLHTYRDCFVGASMLGLLRLKFHRLAVTAAVPVLLLPAFGCVPEDHGWASVYRPAQENKIQVVMPAGAPSISQQFLFSTNGPKHLGIDVIGKVGDPVIAAAGGRVTGSFTEPAYGNRVEITHGPDAEGRVSRTVYKHLDKRLVSKGDTVARGQLVGTLGTTGMLGGGIPHLHFELYRQSGAEGLVSTDPHRLWVDGIGRVTCFDPAASYDDARFRMTYPAPCLGQAAAATSLVVTGLEALLQGPQDPADERPAE